MKDTRSDKMKPQIFTVAGKRIKSIFYPDSQLLSIKISDVFPHFLPKGLLAEEIILIKV